MLTLDQAMDRALSHHRDGRSAEAEQDYRDVLSVAPDHADALHLLGLLLHQTSRSAAAEPLVRRAIAVEPNQAAYHTHLGLVLTTLGDATGGIEAHRRATELDAGSADGHNNLGVALAAAGRPPEAVDCCCRAVALRPDDAVMVNNLGNALRAAGRFDEAAAAYRRTAALAPTAPEPLDNLGGALRLAGRPEEAMAAFDAAFALHPDRPQTLNHVGTLHCDAGRWADAIAAYERAIAGRPDFADAINNLGTALEETGRREAAMAHYRRAMSLAPATASPPWNLALLQLLTGDYAAGWAGYEHRWRQPLQRKVHRQFAQPMWDGSDLGGRRLLLHAEQGFGDAIQFARYAPLAAARGGPVVVECPRALARLFRTLAGVESIVMRDEERLPPFDVHCPLMSLPKVFGTTLATVPAGVPYLHADAGEAARWRARLEGEGPARRVGLVWAGHGSHQKDRARSLPLSALAPLAAVAGVRYYSLQLGEPAAQATAPAAGVSTTDWTAELHDFAATAALVSQLDLVITVDTAVAHLSGALGQPTWVLVPFASDWRWLLEREDSPWYPTVRLFRQSAVGQWAEPIRRVAGQLRSWASM